MFFESFLINVSVMLILIVALIFDYVTKFFSYWYIRHVQYKVPIPFFGSDYHRVLGLRNTTEEVNTMYTKYPKEKYVGYIKSRIPDLIIKDPVAVRKILSTDFSNFHYRGCELDKSRDVCLRNNIFYAEGEKWTFLRRKFERLLKHMSVVQDGLHDCLSGNSGDLKVQQILSEALDAIFRDLLLDSDTSVAVIKNIREKLEKRTLGGKLKSYLKDIFPSIYILLGLSDISSEDLTKLNKPLASSNLLKYIQKYEVLMNGEIKGNEKLKVEETEFLYSAFLLFITEGYVPCHNVLVSLLFELANHEEIQKEIRLCDINATGNDCLSRAIKETLRLHPVYSTISRKCTQNYNFSEKEFYINKGINVTVPINNLHKDEENFNKSEEFNPIRFLESDSDPSPAFLPFGLGPRQCIGEELAMRIVRSVTCAILSKYHVQTSPRTPLTLPVVDYNFKRVINGDVWLRFQPI